MFTLTLAQRVTLADRLGDKASRFFYVGEGGVLQRMPERAATDGDLLLAIMNKSPINVLYAMAQGFVNEVANAIGQGRDPDFLKVAVLKFIGEVEPVGPQDPAQR